MDARISTLDLIFMFDWIHNVCSRIEEVYDTNLSAHTNGVDNLILSLVQLRVVQRFPEIKVMYSISQR